MSLLLVAAIIRASIYLIAAIFCLREKVWDLAVLASAAALLSVAIAVLGPWAGVLAVPYAGYYAQTFVRYALKTKPVRIQK